MKKPKILSFHPKLAALLEVIFGLLMIWWLKNIQTIEFLAIWFVLRLIWWGILIRMVYYSPGLKRFKHWISLFIFYVGLVLWLEFIEWIPAWYLVAGISIFFPAISFWLLPVVKAELSFVGKPQRRFRLFLSMIGLAGFWSGVGAINTFNVFSVSIPIWVVVGSLLSVAVGVFWWKEYGVEYTRIFWWWVIGATILLMEFSTVLLLLPSGFLVNGFMIVWLWYIFWLLARFHLSADGINWKKHRWFLGIQTALWLVFLLFIIKWK